MSGNGRDSSAQAPSPLSRLAEVERNGSFAETALELLALATAQLASTLEEVLSSDALLKRAAAGSYAHPNGFEKLLVTKLPSGSKLLVHSWTDESLKRAAAAEHAHNHRWPFGTLILTGSYRFEVWDGRENEAGSYYRYHYFSPGETGNYQLKPAGRADAALSLTFDLLPGSACYCDSATVHRVRPVELPLRTLFLQGPTDRQGTTVLSPSPAKDEGRLPIERYSCARWREQAVQLRGSFS